MIEPRWCVVRHRDEPPGDRVCASRIRTTRADWSVHLSTAPKEGPVVWLGDPDGLLCAALTGGLAPRDCLALAWQMVRLGFTGLLAERRLPS